jgi:hypothetical protein
LMLLCQSEKHDGGSFGRHGAAAYIVKASPGKVAAGSARKELTI